MAGLFSSGRVNNTDPVALGLRINGSVQGIPIPIGCGRTRSALILVDWEGFYATPVKSSGGGKGGALGSGGKGNTGQYNYNASGLMVAGEGILVELFRLYNGSNIFFATPPTAQELSDLAQLGIPSSDIFVNPTLPTMHNGSYSQSGDSYWTSNFPSRVLNYRGISYFVFPNQNLGTSPTWPTFNIDAMWQINSDIPALGPDANPADWIKAFLTNADWGVQGFPSSNIGDFTTAQNYWRATGMLISVVLTSSTAAASHLKTLMDALNCEFRQSNGALDIVPYGDVQVSGNGYTYTPNVTPIYNLSLTDFLENQGSLGSSQGSGKSYLAFSRANVSDIFDRIQIKYNDRVNLYNPVTIYQTDDATIAQQGRERLSDLKDNTFFALASAASMSIQLQLQRLKAGVNQFQCTVGEQFALLDVMDYISITDNAFQLSSILVRIIEIQENSDRTLTLTLEQVPLTASAPIYGRQLTLGYAQNANSPPGNVNPPIFVEPPDALALGLTLLIGISCSNPENNGGAQVWISSDGTNYSQLGIYYGQTRMGVLTAPLATIAAAPSPPTIDTTNTLAVDLTESLGELISVSAAAFAANATICAVDNEIVGFETATLTAANEYNLTTLSRGAYGSTIGAHATGAPFMRLDGSAFQWDFDAADIGLTYYFKFLAFNQFGVATQNLADVGAYAYTIKGLALSGPLPSISEAHTYFVGTFQYIGWTEISDFRNPILYQISKGPTFAGSLVQRIQAHSPFLVQGDGTYWITAICTPITGLTVQSLAPIEIVISGSQLEQNEIATFDEQALNWPGTLGTNMVRSGAGSSAQILLTAANNILADSNVLVDPDIIFGGGLPINSPSYYTSMDIIDVQYLVQGSVYATCTVQGLPVTGPSSTILTVADILSQPDILGSFSTQYITGWIEISIATNVGGPPSFGSWQRFEPGIFLFRAVQFRFALQTADANTIPVGTAFNYAVQVPNRIDQYTNQSIGSGGLALTFSPSAFNGGPNSGLPLVNIGFSPTASGQYAVVSSLTLSGCVVTVFNNTNTAISMTGVNITVQGY